MRIQPTVQRAAPVANAGWKWRRIYTLVNTGDQALFNHAFPINFGATNALVAGGKLLASGNDLRVWVNGLEVARSLNTINSATDCFVWFVLPFLDAGASVVVEVVYGNANAGAPPTLTNLSDLPAHDVAATGGTRSTKTFRRYLPERIAANAGLGGWPLSSGTQEPVPGFAVPHAWQLAATRVSSDDRRQAAWQTYVDAGTKYQGRFDATRARLEALVFDRDTGSDGVSLREPAGIVSVRCDLRYQNLAVGVTDVTPVGKLVILARAREGDEWVIVHDEDTLQTTETTIATATYSMPAGTKEVAFAVWPKDGLVVDAAARPDRFVYGAWFTTLEVTLADIVTQTLTEAEVEIYELATELRAGGGGDALGVPPYNAVLLGNAKQASGVGTPRMSCKLNEIVRVFCEPKRVEVWNSALTVKVADVPIPVVRAVQGVLLSDGTTVERASEQWLPLEPVVNPLANPDFVANILTWSLTNIPVSVTAAASWDAAIFGAASGSHKVAISASTLGAGLAAYSINGSDIVAIGGRKGLAAGASFRVNDANLVPRLFIAFYDENQIFFADAIAASYTPLLSTWYRRYFAATVPVGAFYYSIGYHLVPDAANQIGDIHVDDFAVNDTEIALLDVASGTLNLTALWKERFVGG